ncbi:MAG: gamma carbonic anhydrase family protein [Candidatus Margulisiibacteriota bacterium]
MHKYDLPDSVLDQAPSIHPSVFVANTATVVGDVILEEDASVFYSAVLRGDINRIHIGKRSNIQDGCVIHVENDNACIVGEDVTVGHRAVLHGCTIEDGCLIGMGAIILNGAVLKKGCVIGAGAIVTENQTIESGSLVVGVPGKVIRNLGPEAFTVNQKWAQKYVAIAGKHKTLALRV